MEGGPGPTVLRSEQCMRLASLLDDVIFPRLVKAKQTFPSPPPVNAGEETRREILRPEIASRVSKGQRVAVAVGSRGIDGIDRVVRSLVDSLKGLGAVPFIVPAMGSHGGATPDGQAKVLAGLGIVEEAIGAPIVSSTEVVELGTSPSGIRVFVGQAAVEADAIVVVNRVKPHTSFRGPVESGLLKMLAVGLGNRRSAETVHAVGFEEFDRIIPEVGEYVLQRLNVIFGVAIIENARMEAVKIVAVEAERMRDLERELLAEARSLMGRIYFRELDVLVVREIGKDISGHGLDPNVTGRYATHLTADRPRIQRIVVLDLTGRTQGNANGIGLADVTTRRLVEKIDYVSMYVNSITARNLATARLPVTMENDRDAIAVALKSCRGAESARERLMIVKNTLELSDVYISESMIPDAMELPNVEVVGGPFEVRFDEYGSLVLPGGAEFSS